MKLPMYVNASICTPCGGRCCKTKPGITAPEEWGAPDVEVMHMRLAAAFRSGKYAIDWWEGEFPDTDVISPRYVRPAIEGDRGIEDPAWAGSGSCVFLSGKGCELEHDARPLQCRTLIPSADGKCKAPEGVKHTDTIASWIPYQYTINRALMESL